MDNALLKESLGVSNRNIMCRLCLSTDCVNEPIGYGDQYLIQKIYECTSIQITPLGGFPSVLCTICIARLEDFYQFRWQCIKNNEIFHRLAVGPNDRPFLAGESRVQSDLGKFAESDKCLPEPAVSIYSANLREVTGMAQHTEVKPQLIHGLHTMGMDVNAENSSFASKYSDPGQDSSVGAGTSMTMRRKRGRPPKQQYDIGTHSIVEGQTGAVQLHTESQQARFSESKWHSESQQARLSESKWHNTLSASGSVPHIDHEPSSSSSENQEGQEWFKIKLEQPDQQPYQTRNDRLQHTPRIDQNIHQHGQPDASPAELLNQSILVSPAESKIQPFMQMGARRSRGRPPREGGCPNEDREEYRFRCQYCSARFKAAINLKLHTNTHTGEKPYLCTACSKSFAHPSNLSVHMKLHSNQQADKQASDQEKSGPSSQQEKKFQCPYCKTLFALAFQLKIHINTHTGQKPYVCKNCGKGFAQPSNLHVHSKKHCRRKQPPFCEKSRGDTHSSSSGNFSQAVENTPAIHTPETHGAVAEFGRISSYQSQEPSLSPMPGDSVARSLHHPSNIDETLLNDHHAINHAMLA